MPLHVSSTVVLIIRRSNCIIQHWYRHTCRWPSGAQVERGLCTGRPAAGVTIPDAVLYNFDLLMMSTIVLETCRGIY